MAWRHYDEELDWGFRQDLTEHTLPSQIARFNRMHPEISGIDDLINVADGIDLIFKYRRFWTHERMRREAPVAVSIMGVIRDLPKGLPGERLALRRSSPLPCVQSRFASSLTPTAQPSRHLSTWV